MLDDEGGFLGPHVLQFDIFLVTHPAAVKHVLLLLLLLPCYRDLFSVDYYDVVTRIDVRSESGLVSPPKQIGYLNCQTTQDLVGRIDDIPSLLNLIRFGQVTLHDMRKTDIARSLEFLVNGFLHNPRISKTRSPLREEAGPCMMEIRLCREKSWSPGLMVGAKPTQNPALKVMPIQKFESLVTPAKSLPDARTPIDPLAFSENA